MRPETFEDLPDQSGRVAIVTGANSGLGRVCSEALAARGATVVLACRDGSRAEDAIAAIRRARPNARVAYLPLDLADLRTVEGFANAFRQRFGQLDILLNNAGLMMTPASVTRDGFELQLGVNHLGHFALTAHLLPMLVETAGSRVVNVSSIAANGGRFDFDDLGLTRRYRAVDAYNRSKLANLLFTRELHARLEAAGLDGPSAVAVHPGVASTPLTAKATMPWHYRLALPLMLRLGTHPEGGARHLLHAATAPGVQSDRYYGPDGLGGLRGEPAEQPWPSTVRADWQAALWDHSAQMTGATWRFERAPRQHAS